jgi:(4-(4-[2-(gamma-L-glutamylamino)ethyl]phenoxymethyl)furan-2-yl)methanamine synthase
MRREKAMPWVGLDVGGANLKICDGDGFATSKPFPLWKSPGRLGDELRNLIAQAPMADRVAVTMTGELCDCFATKADGVRHILQEVERAADGRHTRVYSVDGQWLSISAARRAPRSVAASNWHALARFALRFLPALHSGILVDIGTTTIDVIPLDSENGILTQSRTDLDRLLAGELIYTGIARSPLCAVLPRVPYRDKVCGGAQELFATMRDAYMLLGELPEVPGDMDTADGAPATKVAARRRIGRLLCADEEEFHHRDAVVIAEAARSAQMMILENEILRAVQRLARERTVFVVSGAGEFLARSVLQKIYPQGNELILSLNALLGARISSCAPAHAVAVLARESQHAGSP